MRYTRVIEENINDHKRKEKAVINQDSASKKTNK